MGSKAESGTGHLCGGCLQKGCSSADRWFGQICFKLLTVLTSVWALLLRLVVFQMAKILPSDGEDLTFQSLFLSIFWFERAHSFFFSSDEAS